MKKVYILLVLIAYVYRNAHFEKNVKYSSTLSLTSSLDGWDFQRHAPPALPRERPHANSIGGLFGHRFVLDW